MSKAPATAEFLPMSRSDMTAWGWDALDVLLVTGDAYVDHPAFGAALLGRWLVAHGFRVGIVAQPRWDRTEDVVSLGRPRLFAGVTAGALDSMLAHYTAFRKKRHEDAYTPGGRSGSRPNRACIVYTNLVKEGFPGLPVVLGGIEASLRRVSHYDFWTDSVRRSILLDSKAEWLVYGMGERAILALAQRLREKQGPERGPADGRARTRPSDGTSTGAPIPGIACATRDDSAIPPGAPTIQLPSHEEILEDPRRLMEATAAIERQVQDGQSWAVQRAGDRTVLVAPPAEPLSTDELDLLYSLPFQRRPHPAHTKPIPAMEMIQFSVTSHRGCAGGCSFCTLSSHQGRRIASRSAASIQKEVEGLTRHPDWKGSVSDVGGPTANMWGGRCVSDPAACQRTSCLYPAICRHFHVDQKGLAQLLRALARTTGVRHVRVASGIRHDLALLDHAYTRTLLREFVGGQVKLAPEHLCDNVLRLMRKSSFKSFEQFLSVVQRETATAGKEAYVVPYLMSAFPGCTKEDMRKLAEWLRRRGWKPQQVQCFIPIPGTVAAAMYHAGIDPDGNPIYVARTDAERLSQHHFLVPSEEDERVPWEGRGTKRPKAATREQVRRPRRTGTRVRTRRTPERANKKPRLR